MENYKITKTIRFKLESNGSDSTFQQKVNDVKAAKFDVALFVSKLNNYLDDLSRYLMVDGKQSVNKKLTVKKAWVKQYAKQTYSNIPFNEGSGNSRERNKIGDYYSLPKVIEENLEALKETFRQLADDAGAPLDNRARKAKTGLLFKRLAGRKALVFFISLVENTADKNEKGNLSVQLRVQGKFLIEQLSSAIQTYLPEQSHGLPVSKASFNYYTINKQPVDYEERKKEIGKDLQIDDINALNCYYDKKKKKTIYYIQEDELWITIQKHVGKGGGGKRLLLGDGFRFNAGEAVSLRQLLKNIKASQKAQFNELMANSSATYQTLKGRTDLYLFNQIYETEFKKYKQFTVDIEQRATGINQANDEATKKVLRSELKGIKEKRGELIKVGGKGNDFKRYKAFANLYRSIAQKHGRKLALLKGIEKEEAESQLTEYWALILEAAEQHRLVLIPKGFAQNCYQWIKSFSRNAGNTNRLYWFESFTLRSLRKLCFGHVENGTDSNTFYRGIEAELGKSNSYKDKGKFIKGEYFFQGDQPEIVRFYQEVLKTKYAQSVLNFPRQQITDDIINKKFDSLDEFQIALEKICYRRSVIYPEDAEVLLQRDYGAQIFNITSYDLQRGAEATNIELHTRLWKEFWSPENEQGQFDVRLNPEITITWRDAKESRLRKYGKDSGSYDAGKRNRYLQPQFTLVTTISEHSNAPAKPITFMTDEEFRKSVEAFNAEIEPGSVKFALGLDNGEAELSTLGVFLPEFGKGAFDERISKLKDIDKHGFPVLTIKDLTYSELDRSGKERKIIQNPSYFLNESLYQRTFGKTAEDYQCMRLSVFENKRLLTLDLTTAKVINGHIVSNGDVATFLSLWLRHAQRIVWDMNDHVQRQSALTINIKSNETLTNAEKLRFAEYISSSEKFKKLSDTEKSHYVQWIFDDRNGLAVDEETAKKFNNTQKTKGNFSNNILFAVSSSGSNESCTNTPEKVRHVFKLRDAFYALKSKEEIIHTINSFNTQQSMQQISKEELDLKINHLKQSVVANAIGVIDYLYSHYKRKIKGDGWIVKEGFDTGKVADGLEKFSGNIYRILERKLYQKFQNYGLVPPIKSLLSVRSEGLNGKRDLTIQLGNICFVDPAGTSQNCPVCRTVFGGHSDVFLCNVCGFSSAEIMHSNDGVAGFNIAKRGFENLNQPVQNQ